MEEKTSKLDKLKKNYEIIRKEYNLPKFEEMNDDFEIEKIAEKETELLIRNIRREILEKITNYMRFLEALMNSSNAPFLFMALANQITEKERKIINDLYTKFGKYFIKSISLDNDSNEKEEAELILEMCKEWKEIKEKFKELIEIFDASFEKKKERKSKNYIS
jgi:Na+/phosphate symporter